MIRQGSERIEPCRSNVNLAATSETYRKEVPSRRKSIATTLVGYARGGMQHQQEAEVTESPSSLRAQIHDDQIRTAARRVVVDEELWSSFQSSIKETGAVTGMTLKQTYHELLADQLAEAGSMGRPGEASRRPRYSRSMSLHHMPMSRSTRKPGVPIQGQDRVPMVRAPRFERRKSVSLRGRFETDTGVGSSEEPGLIEHDGDDESEVESSTDSKNAIHSSSSTNCSEAVAMTGGHTSDSPSLVARQ